MRGLLILKILLMNIFFVCSSLKGFSQFRDFWVGVDGATCRGGEQGHPYLR